MTPSVERLAALLNEFDCAMLTVMDPAGHPCTLPLTSLKAPFNGHMWLRIAADGRPAEEIGRGAEVSVAYGAGAGPYVTVYGWAIVLRDLLATPAVEQMRGPTRLRPQRPPRLICVNARAAEVWDAASTAGRRVFAFSHARPAWDEASTRPHEPAVAPRVALRLATSCAQ